MPTRFPGGVSNTSSTGTMAELGSLDPTKYHIFFDDFDTYTAGDWTITTTETGSGNASEALSDADGGVLLITNDDANNDADFFNKKGESFARELGKNLWFKARFKVSDATQSDFVMGLQNTDTTPLAVNTGVYFSKNDGDTNLDFNVYTGITTTLSIPAIATVVDDTYISVGFHIGGIRWRTVIDYYVDDVKTGVARGIVPGTEMTVSFGIQNGEAAAKTMSLDYVYAAKER